MPLGNLRTEHNLNGKTISEDELRQATYVQNQQREGRAPKPNGMQPMPSQSKAKPKERPAKATPSIDNTSALIEANKKDLRKRNLNS